MGRPNSVTLTDLTRALKAAADAGLPVREIRLTAGEARVLFTVDEVAEAQNSEARPKEW